MAIVNNGIVNEYTITPKSITAYKARRGIMDFSQLGMFDQYETGYSFLSVLKMPAFMEKAAEADTRINAMVKSFKYLLEYEFRGLSGLPDVTTNTFTLTDGANEAQLINDVVKDTSVSVSMNYFERRGSLITKFMEYYLTGIKDPYSKAKTYHGLIKNNDLEPSLENEVFTLLYYVTDNTMLKLEKAVLLTNAQPTKAETSMYDSERGQMGNKDLSIEWNCFPITGYEVDKAASYLLADITGVEVYTEEGSGKRKFRNSSNTDRQTNIDQNELIPAVLDSAEYKFGIMDDKVPAAYLGDQFFGRSNAEPNA